MNNFKKCTCTCTEGGSNNLYCDIHGTECAACGKDLDNRACNNKYCDLYDPIAVLVN